MVNSVLASLPISYMSCFDVPVSIKEKVIKFMRHCLWRKKTTKVKQKDQLWWHKAKFVDQKNKEDREFST
jgi:hypothetical protein